MKSIIADLFAFLKKYANVYLFSTGVFILGTILGLFLWRNWDGNLMWIVLNEAFAENKGFLKIFLDTFMLVFILMIPGFIVVITPAILLFQGMIFGVAITALSAVLGTSAAIVYLLPVLLLLAPVMIVSCGSGVLFGLCVIRMVRDEKLKELFRKTAILLAVVILPAVLLYSGIKSAISARFVQTRIAEIMFKTTDKALDTELKMFSPGRDQGNPSDFALFRMTVWENNGTEKLVLPMMTAYKSLEGKTVRICISGDTNLIKSFKEYPGLLNSIPSAPVTILSIPSRGVLVEWNDPGIYPEIYAEYTNMLGAEGFKNFKLKD